MRLSPEASLGTAMYVSEGEHPWPRNDQLYILEQIHAIARNRKALCDPGQMVRYGIDREEAREEKDGTGGQTR